MKLFPVSHRDQLATKLAARRQYESLITGMCAIDTSSYHNQLDSRRLDEHKEEAIEATLTTELEMAELREYKREQNERIASEMDRQNRLGYRDEKMRQQIRNNTQELRDLESKLRAAYVGKGIRAQLAEREVMRVQHTLNVQREQEIRLEQQLADAEYQRACKHKCMVNKMQFRQSLQDQMTAKQQRQQLLYQEFLSEKKELDQIVQRVYMEQMAELQEKEQKKTNFNAGLEELRVAQEIWKENHRKEIEAENARIARFLVEREKKMDEQKRLDTEKKQSSSKFSDRMCAELLENEEKKRQREELLLLLKIEEMEERAELKRRHEMEKRFRDQVHIRIALDQQRSDHVLRLQSQQEDDRQFRQRQMELLAERDKIEQMTQERRRQLVMEHNRIVRSILDERKAKRATDLAKAMEAHQVEMAQKERIQQIIEEERIKILKEHATELVGCFPPGVLRHGDRTILNIV